MGSTSRPRSEFAAPALPLWFGTRPCGPGSKSLHHILQMCERQKHREPRNVRAQTHLKFVQINLLGRPFPRNSDPSATGEALVCEHQIDFDLILENIKDLNSLVGEGISQIEHTPRGARLRRPEPLPLTLYRNGIVVGNGAFRPCQHPSTQVWEGLERNQSHPASTH